jgi:beta-lactamase regulating signal transducer with metallopeptidase domain
MIMTESAWELLVIHVASATLCSLAALALVRSTHTRAGLNYWIWVATSASFLIPIAVVVRTLAAGLNAGTDGPSPDWALAIAAPSRISEVWLFVTWAVGFACALLALLVRCRAVHKLSRAIAREGGELHRRVVAGRLVSIRASALLEGPASVGFFQQTIVIPAGLGPVLSRREMDAVLLHELAHVRRFDNVVEFFHAVVCCLFWFHPLIWFVGVRLRQARELAADEPVIAAGLADDLLSAVTRLAGVPNTGTLMANATSEWEVRLAHLSGKLTSSSRTKGIVFALACAWVAGIGGATRIVMPSATLQAHVFVPPQHAVARAITGAPAGGIQGGVSGGVIGGPRGGVKGGAVR